MLYDLCANNIWKKLKRIEKNNNFFGVFMNFCDTELGHKHSNRCIKKALVTYNTGTKFPASLIISEKLLMLKISPGRTDRHTVRTLFDFLDIHMPNIFITY